MSDRPKILEYLHNIGRDAKILIWARLIVFQVSQYIMPGLKIHPSPPPTISKPPSCLFWLLLFQFLSRILTYPWLTSSLNLSLSLTISYPWLTLSQSLSKKREEAAFSWYGFFTPPVWWYTTVLLMIHHNSASDDTQQCSIAMLQCILWSLMIHHSAYIILLYPFWCICTVVYQASLHPGPQCFNGLWCISGALYQACLHCIIKLSPFCHILAYHISYFFSCVFGGKVLSEVYIFFL